MLAFLMGLWLYSERPLHPAAGSTWFPVCSWTKATVLPCGDTFEHAHMVPNGFFEDARRGREEAGRRKSGLCELT